MRINHGRIFSMGNDTITKNVEKRINPRLKDIIERMRDVAKSEEGCSDREPVCKVKPARARNPEKEKRNALIKERYANGETQVAIGKEYTMPQSIISRICKGVEQKVKPIRAPKKRNSEIEKRNAQIRKRYANGETQRRIAKEYHLSTTSIYNICKGVERKKKTEKEKRNATIRERYANGETQRAIGKDYDLTNARISIICKGVEWKGKIERDKLINKKIIREMIRGNIVMA